MVKIGVKPDAVRRYQLIHGLMSFALIRTIDSLYSRAMEAVSQDSFNLLFVLLSHTLCC